MLRIALLTKYLLLLAHLGASLSDVQIIYCPMHETIPAVVRLMICAPSSFVQMLTTCLSTFRAGNIDDCSFRLYHNITILCYTITPCYTQPFLNSEVSQHWLKTSFSAEAQKEK